MPNPESPYLFGGPRTASARGALERFLEWAVLFLMAALAIIVLLGVGFRKFGAALVWYDEVASILLAWLTYYGASLAALKRAHIGMPTLVDAMRGWPRRTMIVVAEIVTIGFFVLIAWAGWQVMVILEGTTLISLPWVPARVAQSVIPIGAVLFVAAQLLGLPNTLEGPNTPGAPPVPRKPVIPDAGEPL